MPANFASKEFIKSVVGQLKQQVPAVLGSPGSRRKTVQPQSQVFFSYLSNWLKGGFLKMTWSKSLSLLLSLLPHPWNGYNNRTSII